MELWREVIRYKFDLDGWAIDVNLYSQQLKHIYAIVRQKYQALVSRKRSLLSQDDTTPHTTHMMTFWRVFVTNEYNKI